MEQLELPHKLTLSERKIVTVTGVSEVLRFDDTAVVLRTGLGDLEIRGRDLVLKSLSQEGGQLAVQGHICGLDYDEPRENTGLLRRFFP